MQHDRLKYLFERYFNKQDTPKEREEFLTYLEQDEFQQEIMSLMEEHYHAQNEQHHVFSQEVRERMVNVALTSVNIVEHPSSPVRKKYVQWKKIAIAAVMVFVLGISFVLLNNTEEEKMQLVESMDVMPGGNNAILTLGDGKKIILNDAVLGVVKQEGGIVISKTDEGELIYEIKEGGSRNEIHTIETPNGGQYQVVLCDGTRVWMNAASKLSFPASFANNNRQVKLNGEAYFEVTHDKKRPFLVNVNEEMDIRVLGTSFNINAYPEKKSLNTTLLEGAVEVVCKGNKQRITPGQQLQANRTSHSLRVDNDINLDAVMAWKDGYFSKGSMYLSELMYQVKRWYDVDVVFQENINPEFVTTFPKNIKLSELLKLLELTKKVAFEFDGKTIKVKKHMG